MNAYEDLRPHTGAAIKGGHAYHDIPGLEGHVHRRGTSDRVRQIVEHVDVEGKRVLDLGCSVGGIAIGLADAGAREVIGVDWDEGAVAFGNDAAGDRPVQLIADDLATTEAWDRIAGIGPFDVVVWLANWMWVANAAGVDFAKDRLTHISASGARLVFETAERAGSMAGNFGIETSDDVQDLLLDAGFTLIANIGTVADGWHNRSVFIAWGWRED